MVRSRLFLVRKFGLELLDRSYVVVQAMLGVLVIFQRERKRRVSNEKGERGPRFLVP